MWYLEHNLFHFFIRGLELSDEDQHNFSGVVVGVLSVHQGDQVANGLQEGSQTLVTKRDSQMSGFFKLGTPLLSLRINVLSAATSRELVVYHLTSTESSSSS